MNSVFIIWLHRQLWYLFRLWQVLIDLCLMLLLAFIVYLHRSIFNLFSIYYTSCSSLLILHYSFALSVNLFCFSQNWIKSNNFITYTWRRRAVSSKTHRDALLLFGAKFNRARPLRDFTQLKATYAWPVVKILCPKSMTAVSNVRPCTLCTVMHCTALYIPVGLESIELLAWNWKECTHP